MIKSQEETRAEILEGAEKLYNAVKTTLGPKGRNVLIKDKFGSFKITHDGVTVANSIKAKDNGNSLGIDLLKEASKKMDYIGDGTTSVTVLAYHLMVEADKLVAAGKNPMLVKKELDAAVDSIVAKVEKRSKKIERDPKDVLNVATISAGDPELGKIIADVMVEVGYEGGINVEITQASKIETSVAGGYSFDKGYLSPYFITDPSSREVVLNNAAVIVVSGIVRELSEFRSLIDPLMERGVKSFLIIADNVEADALSNLVINKAKGVFNVAAVQAPSFGDVRVDHLKDIATYVNAEVINSMTGNDLEAMDINWVGECEKIIVRESETILMGGRGSADDVEARAAELRTLFEKAEGVEEIAFERRIAQLTGNVATIKVGATTEQEAKEIKYRVDDAIFAIKEAMKNGVVAGGGVTLRDIALDLEDGMIKNALLAPEITLLENSGIDLGKPDYLPGRGVNVLTGKTVDMLEVGIIDPTSVTTNVVRNAFSVAAIATTVGGAVVEDPISQEELNRLMNA